MSAKKARCSGDLEKSIELLHKVIINLYCFYKCHLNSRSVVASRELSDYTTCSLVFYKIEAYFELKKVFYH